LAARSLLEENPTVDEVAHLPAGVTYWQKGTFRLYHHNPPLIKLLAALPVVLSNPIVEPLYGMPQWRGRDPSQVDLAHFFMLLNADRYFELFKLARLMMPLFSLVGGLAVFAWSRRLYGVSGGFVSLALWVFCPNVLAHARLVTSDLGAAAMGVAATYVFWRYLEQPGWRWALGAGAALGLAQLSKFSMLILYGVWPLLWLVRLVLAIPRTEWQHRITRGLGHGAAIIALSFLTIDAGYFFEGVGIPLGDFELGSRALTRPVQQGVRRPASRNPLLAVAWQFRVNRFRDTWLGRLPSPLPEHYVLGFDEQKIETEGIPRRLWDAWNAGTVEEARLQPEGSAEERDGYPVYLDGALRRTGWWNYYLLALVYKVPEGTWLLFLLSVAVLAIAPRPRAEWADEIALFAVPFVILFSISFLTDINLGLRYILPLFPYLFIATGKVVSPSLGLAVRWKRALRTLTAVSLGLTLASSAWIHPHYLAYFNWLSGGPDRNPARLIDSNLDWGQDLIALRKWCQETHPDERIGLAYFGQINPSIFAYRREPFRWFLPPARSGSMQAMPGRTSPPLEGPGSLTPGYYAVSATLLYGLSWRLYDPAPPDKVPSALEPAWDARKFNAFGYFRMFEPIKIIGHSIYIYHLNQADVERAAKWLDPVTAPR
jgi:hypothetical protein